MSDMPLTIVQATTLCPFPAQLLLHVLNNRLLRLLQSTHISIFLTLLMSFPFSPTRINEGPSHLINEYAIVNARPLNATEIAKGAPVPLRVFARMAIQNPEIARRIYDSKDVSVLGTVSTTDLGAIVTRLMEVVVMVVVARGSCGLKDKSPIIDARGKQSVMCNVDLQAHPCGVKVKLNWVERPGEPPFPLIQHCQKSLSHRPIYLIM